jgi:hypothetical protein
MFIVSTLQYSIHRAVRPGLVKLTPRAIGQFVRRVEAGKSLRGTGLRDDVSARIKHTLKAK